jgi:hypothetical protein
MATAIGNREFSVPHVFYLLRVLSSDRTEYEDNKDGSMRIVLCRLSTLEVPSRI